MYLSQSVSLQLLTRQSILCGARIHSKQVIEWLNTYDGHGERFFVGPMRSVAPGEGSAQLLALNKSAVARIQILDLKNRLGYKQR